MNRYARAIQYLTKYPDKITEAWSNPFERKGGSLFLFCTPNGRSETGYGCPSIIKGDKNIVASDGIVTDLIRNNVLIPESKDVNCYMSNEALKAFREIQEKMDEIYPSRKNIKTTDDI